MAKKVWAAVFGLLAVATIWFIFSNSMQGSVESNLQSGWVADFLRPILNPNGWIREEVYLKLVRKLAHFVEFGLLGLWLGAAAVNLQIRKKWYLAALICLLVACTDETIQSFTGRTNSIKDVCIDFSGAVCGLAFVALIVYFIKRIRGKHHG